MMKSMLTTATFLLPCLAMSPQLQAGDSLIHLGADHHVQIIQGEQGDGTVGVIESRDPSVESVMPFLEGLVEELEAPSEIRARLRDATRKGELLPARPSGTLDRACKNSNFTASIAGGFLSKKPWKSLDMLGKNLPTDCFNPAGNGQCWGVPRHKVVGQWNGIKRWAAKACVKNIEKAGNTHRVTYHGGSCKKSSCTLYQGPLLVFMTRKNGGSNSDWEILKNGNQSAFYEIPANQTRVYSWYWKSTKKQDYKVRVRYLKPLDEVDMMMDR